MRTEDEIVDKRIATTEKNSKSTRAETLIDKAQAVIDNLSMRVWSYL
jgi:hypothetical protein